MSARAALKSRDDRARPVVLGAGDHHVDRVAEEPAGKRADREHRGELVREHRLAGAALADDQRDHPERHAAAPEPVDLRGRHARRGHQAESGVDVRPPPALGLPFVYLPPDLGPLVVRPERALDELVEPGVVHADGEVLVDRRERHPADALGAPGADSAPSGRTRPPTTRAGADSRARRWARRPARYVQLWTVRAVPSLPSPRSEGLVAFWVAAKPPGLRLARQPGRGLPLAEHDPADVHVREALPPADLPVGEPPRVEKRRISARSRLVW